MTAPFLPALDYVRFWSKVQTGDLDVCWPWRAGLTTAGYGSFSFKSDLHIASRVAYQLAHGEIPDGLIVRHTCDNPPCCNPRHLLTGTQMDNAIDRAVRGRTNRGAGVWHKVRLTEADVLRIRAAPQAEWNSLAKELGVSRNTLFSAATGQSWGHLPNAVQLNGRSVRTCLDDRKVSYIRTCELTDAHLARVFKTTSHTIYLARIGKTWQHVETPPDTRPRTGGGAYETNVAQFKPQDASP